MIETIYFLSMEQKLPGVLVITKYEGICLANK